MRSRSRRAVPSGVLGLFTLLAAACGSSGITSTQTTFASEDFGADVPVRLVSTGVKPSTLHLFNGFQATFVNEDGAARTLAVDTTRSDQAGCEVMAMVLQPGERRTTAALPGFTACFFRDAQRPAELAFQGVVVTH